MEIRCPRCRWQPDSRSRWECTCRHVWNTFDTQGRCPACDRVWRETQCLRCHVFSPHEDWYDDLPPVDIDAILNEETQHTRQPQHLS